MRRRCLPDLLLPLLEGEADAVFGSRMMTRGDALQRRDAALQIRRQQDSDGDSEPPAALQPLSEFHSGYRVYSVNALRQIPFDRNTNDFHFDTEIIIQLLRARLRIKELPIPTYYGDEICHVNG